MIGQSFLRAQINNWVDSNSLPRFIIISGDKGSGKNTLSHIITRQLSAVEVDCGLSVDAVREAVMNCYRCNGVTVYRFLNADKMSVQAKNALLKITEEPPRSAYFIMTVQNSQNVLETLLSRCTHLKMAMYRKEELVEYLNTKTTENHNLYLKFARNMGDIDELMQIDVVQFNDFCQKVVENIGVVSGVNAFKIANSLRFKEDDVTGYDISLFLQGIASILMEGYCATDDGESYLKHWKALVRTRRCMNEISVVGVKKDSIIDMWILDMRDILEEY